MKKIGIAALKGAGILAACLSVPAGAQNDSTTIVQCLRACTTNWAGQPYEMNLCYAYCRDRFSDPNPGGGNGTTPIGGYPGAWQ